MRSEPFVYDASVPGELARLCNRACARDPAARPESAEAFRAALTAFLRHRSARSLTDAALERVGALRRVLAAASDGAPPADLAAAYRLATEARFGLTESLREHAGEPRATQAMREVVALGVELELRQEHAESAAALLCEVDPPDPELSARVGALRERLAARERERERLAGLERAIDPSVEARARVAPLAVLTGAVAAVGLYATRAEYRTPWGLLVSGAIVAGGFTVAVTLLRGRLFRNAFNRRAVYHIVLGCYAIVADRAFGVLSRRPLDQIITTDLLLFAAIIGSAAITLYRGFWIVAAWCLLAAGVAYALPDRALEVVVGAVVVLLAPCWAVLRRARLAAAL